MNELPVTRSVDSIRDADRKYLFHPFTALAAHEKAGGRIMVEGKGVYLTDDTGRRFMDAMAGLWCVNVGYGHPELAEVLRSQALRLPYFHSFSGMGTDTSAALAEKIVELAPDGMSKVFFGNSGSDANDTQVKLVWYYNNARGKPQKKKIIARDRGYHGVTIMSAGLTGLPAMHAGFDLPLGMIRHTTAPHRLWKAEPGKSDAEFTARLAKDLEDLILAEGPDTVAAFIAEPVQGAGGVLIPPEGYFPAIQAVLRKYDILLIADEVICGFGRLGTWFGSDMLGIEPDLMTIAKGVTSAYFPVSGCIVSDKVWQVLVGESAKGGVFGHGYTYSAHPLGAAVALANLAIIERDGLVERAASVGAFMNAELRRVFDGHPLVGEVRGTGLVAAVEFVAEKHPARRFAAEAKVGARIANACLERGMITRALPDADTISFSPPFVVTQDQIAEMASIALAAADSVLDELTREGHRLS